MSLIEVLKLLRKRTDALTSNFPWRLETRSNWKAYIDEAWLGGFEPSISLSLYLSVSQNSTPSILKCEQLALLGSHQNHPSSWFCFLHTVLIGLLHHPCHLPHGSTKILQRDKVRWCCMSPMLLLNLKSAWMTWRKLCNSGLSTRMRKMRCFIMFNPHGSLYFRTCLCPWPCFVTTWILVMFTQLPLCI